MLSNNSKYVGPSVLRYAHELLFSLVLGYIATFAAFQLVPTLSLRFIHLELAIDGLLGIPHFDFVPGYLAVLVPSLLVALCIWSCLQIFSQSGATKLVLGVVAGITLLLSPAISWFYGHPSGWPHRITFIETTLVILFIGLYLSRRLDLPTIVTVFFVMVHFLFWIWISANVRDLPPDPGTILPILGLPAALVWIGFMKRSGLRTVR